MLSDRLARINWENLVDELDEEGHSVVPSLLCDSACQELIRYYSLSDRFRSVIAMERHGFGAGEYQYFRYPLPDTAKLVRTEFYARLVTLAQLWASRLKQDVRYPTNLADFLRGCHANGQNRPTPLLLKYGSGDFNRLHQDLYGDISFPFQLAICLNQPGDDFVGGEFVFTEQRPRMQTRAQVVPLGCGDAVIFANRYRPIVSANGYSRAVLRHGVSKIKRGIRYCLGVIFHDAA